MNKTKIKILSKPYYVLIEQSFEAKGYKDNGKDIYVLNSGEVYYSFRGQDGNYLVVVLCCFQPVATIFRFSDDNREDSPVNTMLKPNCRISSVVPSPDKLIKDFNHPMFEFVK